MKIRTIYFKVASMEKAVAFWQGFFDKAPPKRSEYWSEFKKISPILCQCLSIVMKSLKA